MCICLQTRLSKMLAETNILQLGTLTENYNSLNIIRSEIILLLTKKFTVFCQIEPGIHASTVHLHGTNTTER